MFSPLELTLILLVAGVLGVVAFRMMHLPPMLGYLVVGILIGQHALGLAEENETTHLLGELGVVFLMFSIGLEFSMPKLFAMRRIVFGLGMAQVASTIAVTMLIGWLAALLLPQYFAISWGASFALGGVLAMSSTAIASKMLTERMELESEHGRQILGILLFQDIAVVPLLILVPALAGDSHDLAATMGMAALKAVIVLVLLLVIGQRLMSSWFRIVVKRRSQELFMLNLLLITLGAAWITQKTGLSLALGAFVAGMLISETEYKHQVEEDIKPFRDILLGLFFISIGMLLDVGMVLENWWLVLLLVFALVLVKFGLTAGLARLAGAPAGAAVRTGLGLAQAGEFGFVLLNQAGNLQLIDPMLVQPVLASMVLSMLIAPFLIAKSDAITLKLSANEWMSRSLVLTQIAAHTMTAQKHVLIAGFGRSGQNLAKLLDEEGVPYHALDLDPDRVREAQSSGANVSYGDASRRESLLAAGIHRAATLVITYTDTPSALRVLRFSHELAPELPVIVRSRDDSDLEKLRAGGAAEVVPEALEGSLMLASHALIVLGVPLRRVLHRVQAARAERYSSLRGFFYGAGDSPGDPEQMQMRLHAVTLKEGAKAIGKPLDAINLQEVGAEAFHVRRNKSRFIPTPETILQAGDTVVVRGSAKSVARAEERLLR